MQTQEKNKATKKPPSVEDESVNKALVSEVEKQLTLTSDELKEVKALLQAQKEQELQQINELEEVRAQLAQKEQKLQQIRMKQVVIELK